MTASMDFFGRQRAARHATWRLVVMFVLAIPCIALIIYVGGAWAIRLQGIHAGPFWHPKGMLWVFIGTLMVVTYGSLVKIRELKAGGSAVVRRLGARPIQFDTQDRLERRLLNVVEEMAIASGVPVPQVWLFDEPTINALAAGYSTGDAAVAVTRGCLESLDRDQLQGVIAHEFSHILNGDMRLNIRLMGVLNGLVGITVAGTTLLYAGSSTRRGRSRNPGMLLGLVLIVSGWIGVLFARLIKAAVSRQREFLADAAAVQFTRNPSGIGGALKRLGGYADDGGVGKGSTIHSGHAEEASHMFFAAAVSNVLDFTSLFATHPPIEERIRRIDPSFKVEGNARRPQDTTAPQGAAAALASPGSGLIHNLTPERLVDQVGEVTPSQLAYSRMLLGSLPFAVRASVQDPTRARAVIYALLLDDDGPRRREQMRTIQPSADPETLQQALQIFDDVAALDETLRLPLVDLALPALREMSKPEVRDFCENLDRLRSLLDEPDRELFVFSLNRVVRHHLGRAFGPARQVRRKATVDDERTVLAVLAHAGSDDLDAARKAYADGLATVPGTPAGQQPPRCSVADLDRSLDRLVGSDEIVRRRLLIACARTVASDGVLRQTEAELLRAIADTFGCPVPPLSLGETTPSAERPQPARS